MRKRVPTHPGAMLREDVLPHLGGMSVSAFARLLGVSRQNLHAVLAERSGVTAEMALRLGALLGNGPQLWVDMQTQHDRLPSFTLESPYSNTQNQRGTIPST